MTNDQLQWFGDMLLMINDSLYVIKGCAVGIVVWCSIDLFWRLFRGGNK